MTSKFMRLFLAVAVLFAISALAQTGSAATPSAPTAAPAPAPNTATSKVGTINIQEAIFGSNEGQRDVAALSKKYEPKNNELKNQNEELDGLKKQLTTQQDKLNEDALATLKKQIESKQKSFDRAVQDFQEEAGTQQQEIATRILGKMAPMIVKYAQESGFTMIVDTSTQWPRSPILWSGENVDITKAIVDAYNVQSGVPAPAATTPKPATPKPSTGAAPAKPAAPKTDTPK